MNGRLVGIIIVGVSLLVGAAIYYLQVYGYYERVDLEKDAVELRLTSIVSGAPEPIIADGFEGIDADSSPLRFRGCFTTTMSLPMLSETFVAYEAPEPLIAPPWFDCFDARAIGAALESGEALAFLSERDIAEGVDRVMAFFPDGRAFVWHQLNEKFRE